MKRICIAVFIILLLFFNLACRKDIVIDDIKLDYLTVSETYEIGFLNIDEITVILYQNEKEMERKPLSSDVFDIIGLENLNQEGYHVLLITYEEITLTWIVRITNYLGALEDAMETIMAATSFQLTYKSVLKNHENMLLSVVQTQVLYTLEGMYFFSNLAYFSTYEGYIKFNETPVLYYDYHQTLQCYQMRSLSTEDVIDFIQIFRRVIPTEFNKHWFTYKQGVYQASAHHIESLLKDQLDVSQFEKVDYEIILDQAIFITLTLYQETEIRTIEFSYQHIDQTTINFDDINGCGLMPS